MLLRSFSVRAVREERREVDFLCSTDSIDSYDEIVAQNWDLTRYLKNPVVLYAHDARERLPIGQASNIHVGPDGLEATIRFSKITALAEEVWQQVLEKTLRAVSVGFKPRDVRWEKHDDRELYVLDDNVLYEISVCPIGANEDALARSQKSLDVLKSAARKNALSRMATKADETKKKDPIMSTPDDKDSTIATLRSTITEREKKITDVEKELEREQAKSAALTVQNEAIAKERDAFKLTAEKATADVVKLEVDKLVGDKIEPHEKDQFVELRLSNPELFEKFVAQRKGKGLTIPALPTEAPKAQSTTTAGTTQADWDEFEKSLDSSAEN